MEVGTRGSAANIHVNEPTRPPPLRWCKARILLHCTELRWSNEKHSVGDRGNVCLALNQTKHATQLLHLMMCSHLRCRREVFFFHMVCFRATVGGCVGEYSHVLRIFDISTGMGQSGNTWNLWKQARAWSCTFWRKKHLKSLYSTVMWTE